MGPLCVMRSAFHINLLSYHFKTEESLCRSNALGSYLGQMIALLADGCSLEVMLEFVDLLFLFHLLIYQEQ